MRLAAMTAALLFAGCLFPADDGPEHASTNGNWDTQPCPGAVGDDEPMDFLLRSEAMLYRYTWEGGFQEAASLHIDALQADSVAVTGEVHRTSMGYVAEGSWTSGNDNGHGLLVLDEALGVDAAVPVPEHDLSDIDADGDRVYATGENLTVYDLELRVVDRIDLLLAQGKRAHDILVTHGRILLLDNVIDPLYLLIYDQESLSLERRINESGQHLGGQWFDEVAREWGIISTMSTMGGYTTDVLRYRLDGQRLDQERVYWQGRNYGREEQPAPSGQRLLGWTQEGPLWLAFEAQDDVSVGPVVFGDGVQACIAETGGDFAGIVARDGQVVAGLGEEVIVQRADATLLASAQLPRSGTIVA